MIRHVVLFKFKEDVDEARRKILITALSALREKISLVKELEVGVVLAISTTPMTSF